MRVFRYNPRCMAMNRKTRQKVDQVAFTIAVIAAALCINKVINNMLSWPVIVGIIILSIPTVIGIRLALHYRNKRRIHRQMSDDE